MKTATIIPCVSLGNQKKPCHMKMCYTEANLKELGNIYRANRCQSKLQSHNVI